MGREAGDEVGAMLMIGSWPEQPIPAHRKTQVGEVLERRAGCRAVKTLARGSIHLSTEQIPKVSNIYNLFLRITCKSVELIGLIKNVNYGYFNSY